MRASRVLAGKTPLLEVVAHSAYRHIDSVQLLYQTLNGRTRPQSKIHFVLLGILFN